MSRNRPSTISRLDSKIREKINLLRQQGRTIDEIMQWLDKMEVEVSRSAVGRHVKKLEQVTERVRRSRALSEAIVRQFGDKEVSDTARLNLELMHDIIMRVMIGDEDQEEVVFDPKSAMFLATALEKLTKARKSDLDAEVLAAKEQERRVATEEAAEQAVTAARKQGLSAETVEAIKASILGVDHAS